MMGASRKYGRTKWEDELSAVLIWSSACSYYYIAKVYGRALAKLF
jgi:hypothetical protein